MSSPSFIQLPEALAWLDSDNAANDPRASIPGRPELESGRLLPFLFLHAGCILVLWTGWSWPAVFMCVLLYCVRMFAITAFYHRYFSHRTFKTSRAVQFLFAIVGVASVQRGPLWWAAHHRHHHASSDTDEDIHSPQSRSFFWSHMGWIASSRNMPTNYSKVRDFEGYPELRLINRFDWLVPTLMFIGLYLLGELVGTRYPATGTSGAQMVVWGFFISTTILFHATCSINSVAHVWGYRSYDTLDNSRNNWLLALITFGEGWHNNHHMYPAAVRQGIRWWEVDITYLVLLAMRAFGLVWDLKPVPSRIRSTPMSGALAASHRLADARDYSGQRDSEPPNP